MKNNRIYWIVIAVGLCLLILPLLINSCYLWETNIHILHSPSPWTSFWATYLAAIASFIMIFFTWKTLNEMKRQWKETNRARLTFAIVAYDGLFLLKITNCGSITAYDIKLKLNQQFLDNHFSCNIKKQLATLAEKPFCIEAGVSKYYYISPIYSDASCRIGNENYDGSQIKKWLDEHKSDRIIIKGEYNNTYEIDEDFSLEEYINGAIVVKDDLTLAIERIKKGAIVQNNQYYPMQKSLDIIAKGIQELRNRNEQQDNEC